MYQKGYCIVRILDGGVPMSVLKMIFNQNESVVTL